MDKTISEIKLQSVIGSMKLEGFELTEEEIQNCRRILEGEITAEELCQKVIDNYSRREGYTL